MATIAEQLVGSALEASQEAPDLAGNFAKGAQLAQNIQAMKIKRQTLEKDKGDQVLKKLDKWGEWHIAAEKMPDGAAKDAFQNNFMINGAAAMGIDKIVAPGVQKMLEKDTTLGALIAAKVQDGEIEKTELLGALQNEEAMANLIIKMDLKNKTPEQISQSIEGSLGKIEDAGKVALLESKKAERAETEAEGRVEAARVTREQAGKVAADSALGRASIKFLDDRAEMVGNIDELKEAMSTLASGDIKTGTVFQKIFGGSDTALTLGSPGVAAAQAQIRTAIIGILRPTLGAQFSENEGKRIMGLAFDARFSTKENMKRVSNRIKKNLRKVFNKEQLFLRKDLVEVEDLMFPTSAQAAQVLANKHGIPLKEAEAAIKAAQDKRKAKK